MLVSHYDYEEAESLLGNLDSHSFPIELIEFETDDLWLRDTGPTFVTNNRGDKIAIDFNFIRDTKVAKFIANLSSAILEETDLVLEGGCFDVDGHGTAILTKSCVLNNNRNPHLSRIEVEQELMALLGLRKLYGLKG